MIKLELNRDNITFIGLVIVVLLLLGQCSSNASLRDKVKELKGQVTLGEANLMASQDSVEIKRQENGNMIAEISAFQMTNEQLIKTNKKLASDYAKALDLNKKLKGVNSLLKAEITDKDSIIFNSNLNPDSTFSFAAVSSVPFGGVKDSGYGRIHGPEGLLEFTYPRTVVKTIFNIPIVFTTFGRTKFADKFIKVAIKTLHSKGIG